jgi:hypothetical protein
MRLSTGGGPKGDGDDREVNDRQRVLLVIESDFLLLYKGIRSNKA